MVEARGTHCCAMQTELEAQHTPPQGGCPVTAHRPVASCEAEAVAAADAPSASTQPRPGEHS